MRSITPLIEAFAPQIERDDSWQPLLYSAQQLALFEGQNLPWGHNGLASTELIGYLRQLGDELVLDDEPLMAVMDAPLGNQSYCSETNKVIGQSFKPMSSRFEIVDNNIRYELSSIQKPDWAYRFHRKPNGTVEAVHLDGVSFELVPSSIQQPRSFWRLADSPWSWAQGAGIDEYGLWAELAIKSTEYRLRWIPPGTFMMGSPDKEQGRYEDEQLHEVTLSEGYWLGETTVTQGLWEAVMGNNPSNGEKGEHIPVSKVSWNDCSVFIASLQEYLSLIHI